MKIRKNYIIVFIVTLFVIIICYFAITKINRLGEFLNLREAGQIGDAIGGITAPIIALFAAILTFIAFYVQFQANQQQRQDIAVQRFESNFFEMLKIHRENVEKMKLGEYFSQNEVFYEFFREYKIFYKIIEKILYSYIKIEKVDSFMITYIFFYFGYRKYPKDKIISIIKRNYKQKIDEVFDENVENFFNEMKKIDIQPPNQSPYYHVSYMDMKHDGNINAFLYIPFEGHNSMLGNYYRHLYNTVRYVDEAETLNIFNDEKVDEKVTETYKYYHKLGKINSKRYFYIKILRTQLSDFEQMMLLLNSMSSLGEDWNKNEYIVKYQLVKNIPSDILNQIVQKNDINDYFKDLYEKDYNKNIHKIHFEWEENTNPDETDV